MKFICFTIFATACIAAAALAAPAADVTRHAKTEQASHAQRKSDESSRSRSRRWILSWLLGHSMVMDHARRQANASKVPVYKPVQDNSIHEIDSTEVHSLPGTAPVDLSGDLRVNYQEGRGRTGALAEESDAEVFDWNLLQEDRNRNAPEPNPHYFQSNSGSLSSSRPTAYGVPSASYGQRRARPASGVLSSSSASGLNRFNRFPIAFEQSQEYANLNRRSSSIKAVRA
ncbi:hypothetical protein FHG87_000681 [Trinorchestia longiramus]|nr:hypothetical protein FHG87_000681 [Trinorchestia longiramus]